MMGTLVRDDSMLIWRISILSSVRIATRGMVFVFCLILGVASATNAADDSYIAGYAAAVLEHEFNVPGAIVQVHEGVVVLIATSLGKADRQKVIAALEKIPGVVRTEVREDAEPSAVPAGSAAGGYPAKASQARVKISSSRSPRGSFPCRPALAAFLHGVPSRFFRSGAEE